MERIVIIGNSGSGKTYLAQMLICCFHLELIHLDKIVWEPGGVNKKRPTDVVYTEIATLAQGESWIVEGVFGELAQEFLPKAERLLACLLCDEILQDMADGHFYRELFEFP